MYLLGSSLWIVVESDNAVSILPGLGFARDTGSSDHKVDTSWTRWSSRTRSTTAIRITRSAMLRRMLWRRGLQRGGPAWGEIHIPFLSALYTDVLAKSGALCMACVFETCATISPQVIGAKNSSWCPATCDVIWAGKCTSNHATETQKANCFLGFSWIGYRDREYNSTVAFRTTMRRSLHGEYDGRQKMHHTQFDKQDTQITYPHTESMYEL